MQSPEEAQLLYEFAQARCASCQRSHSADVFRKHGFGHHKARNAFEQNLPLVDNMFKHTTTLWSITVYSESGVIWRLKLNPWFMDETFISKVCLVSRSFMIGRLITFSGLDWPTSAAHTLNLNTMSSYKVAPTYASAFIPRWLTSLPIFYNGYQLVPQYSGLSQAARLTLPATSWPSFYLQVITLSFPRWTSTSLVLEERRMRLESFLNFHQA